MSEPEWMLAHDPEPVVAAALAHHLAAAASYDLERRPSARFTAAARDRLTAASTRLAPCPSPSAATAPLDDAAFDEAQDATRRTRLANERTYLAWWRTGLTALAVSLAAGRVCRCLSHRTAWPYEVLGAGFAVLGVACIVNAYQREREIDRALQEGRFASMDPARRSC